MHTFRCGMLLHGVDMMRTMGMLSGSHSQADLERTVEAFDATLDLLLREGAIH